MTVATQTVRVAYAGDGTSIAFAVPFPFFDAADLEVIERVVATGAETPRTLGIDYTVTGGGGGSGTVTASVAPSAAVQWVIRRATALTQTADYVPNDPFPAETHERALDRLTLIAQELAEARDRSIRLPKGESGTGATLAPAPDRRGTVLVFDESTGLPLVRDPLEVFGALPPRIAFAARDVSGQLIPNAVNTKVMFATELFDDGAAFASGRWTPGRLGWAVLTASIRFDPTFADGAQASIAVYKNGTVLHSAGVNAGAAEGPSATLAAICRIDAADDYFEVYAFHNAGGSRALHGSEEQNFFTGIHLGDPA